MIKQRIKPAYFVLFLILFVIIWVCVSLSSFYIFHDKKFLDILILDISTIDLLIRLVILLILIIIGILLKFDTYSKQLKKYNHLFESINDLIFFLNEDYTCYSVNNSFLTTFNLNYEDVINKPISEIDFSINLKNKIIKSLKKMTDSKIKHLDLPFELTDKSAGYIVSIKTHKSGKTGGKYFSIIFHDNTRQKKFDRLQKLLDNQQENTKRMASLEVLSAGMAHEINNPNNAIMINSSLLQRIFEDLKPVIESSKLSEKQIAGFNGKHITEKIEIMLRGIFYGSERIKNITDELSNYSKKDYGQFDKVDINRIIRTALESIDQKIIGKVENYTVDLSDSKPLYIRGIYNMIEKVIINIVKNACESLINDKKDLFIYTKIDQKIRKIIILISDSGIGMEKEIMQHILDPFFTTKRDSGNIGLGLSITNRTIEKHSGTLNFISEKNSGTTAIIQLPEWEDL